MIDDYVRFCEQALLGDGEGALTVLTFTARL